MDVEERQVGQATVVELKGRLDSMTSAEFQPRLLDLIGKGGTIIVDAGALNYVSSAGLRVLMLAAKQSRSSGARVALAALQPSVRKVFDISGFSALFEIHDSAEAACSALGSGDA